MIIVLKPEATAAHAQQLLNRIESSGLKPLHMPGSERVVIGAIGDERVLAKLHLESDPLVESVKPILSPYKLVSRELQAHDTVVQLGKTPIGANHFTVIAGPCSVEDEGSFRQTAQAILKGGASAMRGGAFKPRSSPYSFQGLGVEGLQILQKISREVGLPTVTEVVEIADIEAVAEYADAFQVGARNMQNFRLLRELGQQRKPVLLKRGMSATVEELLLAAEYILAEGNSQVILCERGIRTFETSTRNTLDLNAIPVIKQRSHLPVIVDPSHGTGHRELVAPMALAAAAAGADGIIVEVHHDPAQALSDGKQTLYPHQFEAMMTTLKAITAALGKELVTC